MTRKKYTNGVRQSITSQAKSIGSTSKGAMKDVGIRPNKNNKKRMFSVMPKAPLFVAMLIVVWAFLYFWYGDTIAVAEQRGFFAFDSVAMQPYTSQPMGWLYAIGRFMLLSGVIPLLASLLIALMLVVSAWLIDRALNLKGWYHSLALVVPFAYFAYLFYMGLNLVYLREVSWIMTIPLIGLVCSLVFAVVMRLFAKRKIVVSSFWKHTDTNSPREAWGLYGLLLLLFCGSVATACTYAENDRITCTMERYLYDEDWDCMVETAKKASHPSRTVTALYALALNQNGQLASDLFNIPMQYRNAHLTRKNGGYDGGLDFVVVNCNFYAGLTRPAYHEAMEQMVLEGPSIDKLKIMVKCAVIDKENALAEKYLAILKNVPFESDFVEKYSSLLNNYNLVLQDHALASVIELQPVNDSFEQNYREPLFLGYNVNLKEAKSIRGLNNSLYACLYSKDMVSFGQRIMTMIENRVQLPKVFEEAIIVMNIKNLSSLKSLGLSPYSLQGMKDFLADCFNKADIPSKGLSKEEKNEMAKEKGRKFRDKYLGTYEFYYYFQNIPDENYIIPEEMEKGGVN